MDEEEYHSCHFCGEYVKDGYESNGTRHFLSDCRSDLVEHEIGPECTWSHRKLPMVMSDGSILPPIDENRTCYAYQDENWQWTNEHIHFYKDGPM